jgi:hypothetical protein
MFINVLVCFVATAWATEYDTETNTYRVQDVVTNTFCAGGLNAQILQLCKRKNLADLV